MKNMLKQYSKDNTSVGRLIIWLAYALGLHDECNPKALAGVPEWECWCV